ncbi:MAG: DUF1080 domain-containing protein, partial [bacterium]|nr:DUF1080 domain-containing protein [bacterium]
GFLVQYENWRKAYRQKGWNRLRVRIVGQPPRITAWLNGVKTVDFQDNEERYPREGYIGLQVHGGAGAWGKDCRVRFRQIRLLNLEQHLSEVHTLPRP